MNCFNHPERPATAFCQHCGKPLCPECIRSADGLLLCEPDFLTRRAAEPLPGTAGSAAGPSPAGWTPQPGRYSAVPGQYAAVPGQSPVQPVVPVHASPVLAGLLGFIPGVGAMYNGQFIKALLHVVIFIVLIGATEHFDLAGLLLTAWIFYQVFDAAQTASARRDGRPLPDPFGMLDLSQRLGPQPNTPAAYGAPFSPYPAPPSTPENAQKSSAAGFQPVSFAAQNTAPAGSTFGAETYAPAPGYPPAAPPPYQPGSAGAWTPGPAMQPQSPVDVRRGEPAGAIVLIVVGLLFLLSTLGFLDIGWIGRGWPVLVLLLGVWLLIRRLTAPLPPATYPPPPAGTAPAGNGGSAAPGTGFSRQNPLSIASQSPAPHTQDIDEEEK